AEALLRHRAVLRPLREGHVRALPARSPREPARARHGRVGRAARRRGPAVHRSGAGLRGARGGSAHRTADSGIDAGGGGSAGRGVGWANGFRLPPIRRLLEQIPMNPQRLATKLFTTRPIAREHLHPFIGVFHRFIQQAAVPGLLIDVADYAHVPDGPGVILIGHDVDYGTALPGGHTGLLTTRKHAGDAGLAELFRDTLAKALAAARASETDDTVSVRFAPDAIEISFPDRLAAPNSLSAFD